MMLSPAAQADNAALRPGANGLAVLQIGNTDPMTATFLNPGGKRVRVLE